MSEASKAYTGTVDETQNRASLQKSRFAPKVAKRIITLKSGNKVKLELITLSGAEEIKTKTDVDSENIRNQEWLTEDGLSDIIDDIGDGYQLFSAIGYKKDDGTISVVDGSRRRQCAILRDSQYTIEVADKKLSKVDAEWIVSRSDLSKKFTDYEWGSFYTEKMQHAGLKQKELAEKFNISSQKMNRYINAFKVQPELYELFVDRSVISSKRDSEHIISINNTLVKLKADIEELVICAQETITTKAVDSTDPDEHKDIVFDVLDQLVDAEKLKAQSNPPRATPKPPSESENLYQGEHKQEFARLLQNSSKKSTITLSRISVEKQKQIKEAIKKILGNEK